MKRNSYSDQFKIDAVRRVSVRKERITEVARQLKITDSLLHAWRSDPRYKGSNKVQTPVAVKTSPDRNVEDAILWLRKAKKATDADVLKACSMNALLYLEGKL